MKVSFIVLTFWSSFRLISSLPIATRSAVFVSSIDSFPASKVPHCGDLHEASRCQEREISKDYEWSKVSFDQDINRTIGTPLDTSSHIQDSDSSNDYSLYKELVRRCQDIFDAGTALSEQAGLFSLVGSKQSNWQGLRQPEHGSTPKDKTNSAPKLTFEKHQQQKEHVKGSHHSPSEASRRQGTISKREPGTPRQGRPTPRPPPRGQPHKPDPPKKKPTPPPPAQHPTPAPSPKKPPPAPSQSKHPAHAPPKGTHGPPKGSPTPPKATPPPRQHPNPPAPQKLNPPPRSSQHPLSKVGPRAAPAPATARKRSPAPTPNSKPKHTGRAQHPVL
jgi:hypothetical protein